MRVLHLIDPAGTGAGPCTARLLAEATSRIAARHDVIVIGHGGDVAAVRRCGVAVRGSVPAPLGRAALAQRRLAACIAARQRDGGAYDIVHGWTPGAAAAGPGPPRRTVAGAPAAPGGDRASRADLARLRRDGVPLLAGSAAVAAALVAAGAARRQVRVVAPGIDPSAVTGDRQVLRADWGADDATLVAGLIGEPAAWTDAEFAVNAAGRAALTGRDVRLVLHPAAAGAAGLRRWLHRLRLRGLVVLDERIAEPWRCAAGLDLALLALVGGAVPPAPAPAPRLLPRPLERVVRAAAPEVRPSRRPRPGLLPALWAMAAGVPVVAARGPAAREVIDDGCGGHLIEPGDHDAAARHLLEAAEPRRAGRLRAAAQATVRRRHDPAAFAEALAAAYRQRLGGPLRAGPEPPPSPAPAPARVTT